MRLGCSRTGRVMLWGGRDALGQPRHDGDVFDPRQGTFAPISTPIPLSSLAPELTGSVPDDGAIDVPLESTIALRFSKPVRVETVSPLTVLVTGPHGLVPAQVVAAEGGALVFVTPRAPLEAGAAYTVSINGVRDDAAFLVAADGGALHDDSNAHAQGHEAHEQSSLAGKGSASSGHDHGTYHDDHASACGTGRARVDGRAAERPPVLALAGAAAVPGAGRA